MVLALVQTGAGGFLLGLEGLALHLAVGALKDGLEFLVLLQGPAPPAPFSSGGGGGLRCLRLLPQTQPAVHVHVLPHLIPLHHNSCAVVAEHGVGGVVRVPLRVVAQFRGHLLLVVAGGIAPRGAAKPPPAPGIGSHLLSIVPQAGHRGLPGEGDQLLSTLRGLHSSAHVLQIGHGPAHTVHGHLQGEVVDGLQQKGLRLHEALAHRPVGGLAEVAPLSVLHMGPPGN